MVVAVVESVRPDVGGQVSPLRGELFLRQRLRSGGQPARAPVRQAPGALAVLVADHAAGIPEVGEDVAEDPAVVGDIAVEILGAFPDDDGGQVRWLQRGDQPLGHGVVGDAAEPDLAAAPRLGGGPLDGLVEVRGLLGGEAVEVAAGPAGAARVHPHDRVTVGHPLLGVHHLPDHVLARRGVQDLRVPGCQLVPCGPVAVAEVDALPVRSHGHDHRCRGLACGPEDVRGQDDPVRHGDLDVPLDEHPVGSVSAGHSATRVPGSVMRTVVAGASRAHASANGCGSRSLLVSSRSPSQPLVNA